MAKKFILTIILLLIFTQGVFALIASSENYSVSMFKTGLATSNSSSSTDYEATTLSEAQGTTRNAESDAYTVNIGFFENTTYYRTVSIISYSISPKSAVIGSTIELSISALNYQSVWVKITSPNNQQQILNLVNNQYVNYLPIPSVLGRYNVTFYANSSFGAIASVVDYFELIQQTTQPTPPPFTGGGTTTIIEKCSYIWDCTPWKICSEGKQTRVCTNIGTCTGTENKPREEINCSEALFDITFKLKEIILTQNKTLKFNIELTEKMGVDKIDVHIKYSIINSDNNEIFSQIETKAIQENLSYEKEIDEIKLVDGKYTLRVDILYGNLQRAFAEQKIKVMNGKIETEESVSNIQKIMGLLNNYKIFFIIIIIIIIIIPFSRFLLFKKGKHQTKFCKKVKSKRKYFAYYLLALLIFALLMIITKTNRTGRVINNISSYNWKIILISLIIISIVALLIILRKRLALICKKIIELLSAEIVNKNKKYPKNSIKGLIDKNVYSDGGHCIGKVRNVILKDNKIAGLNIKLDKKYKFKAKGIIVNYKHVKSINEIVIIDKEVLRSINEKL